MIPNSKTKRFFRVMFLVFSLTYGFNTCSYWNKPDYQLRLFWVCLFNLSVKISVFFLTDFITETIISDWFANFDVLRLSLNLQKFWQMQGAMSRKKLKARNDLQSSFRLGDFVEINGQIEFRKEKQAVSPCGGLQLWLTNIISFNV